MERGLDSLEGTGFEMEQESYGEYTGAGEFGFETGQGEGVFGEAQEQELAAELLEITNEQELNQFIGKLIKSAGRAVGGFVRSPIGQALGGVLKQAARTALPMAGAALGNLVLPGVGGAIGGKLASAAGKAFGLELEGLSQEDREYEVAKRFVRLAGEATRNATAAPPNANPQQVARVAFANAARVIAPGLAGAISPSGGFTMGPMGNGGGQSGRWFRRGRRIIIVGA
jgi:hypothetical protein